MLKAGRGAGGLPSENTNLGRAAIAACVAASMIVAHLREPA